MPQLTETVNLRAGLIRASGHLTLQGADLLSGTADSLRGSGHARVILDLRDVATADAAGLDVLRGLGEEFAARGGELVVRHAPRLTVERRAWDSNPRGAVNS
jgi:anti-anti-sigma regulatory factor